MCIVIVDNLPTVKNDNDFARKKSKKCLRREIEKLYHSNNNQIFNVYVYFEYTSSLVVSFSLSLFQFCIEEK
jgi:hypothetical protein